MAEFRPSSAIMTVGVEAMLFSWTLGPSAGLLQRTADTCCTFLATKATDSGPTIAMQPAAAFGVAPTCAEPCETSADVRTSLILLQAGRAAKRPPLRRRLQLASPMDVHAQQDLK